MTSKNNSIKNRKENYFNLTYQKASRSLTASALSWLTKAADTSIATALVFNGLESF